MAKTIVRTSNNKVVKNKNGTTTSYSKATSGSKWIKTSTSSSNNRKKR